MVIPWKQTAQPTIVHYTRYSHCQLDDTLRCDNINSEITFPPKWHDSNEFDAKTIPMNELLFAAHIIYDVQSKLFSHINSINCQRNVCIVANLIHSNPLVGPLSANPLLMKQWTKLLDFHLNQSEFRLSIHNHHQLANNQQNKRPSAFKCVRNSHLIVTQIHFPNDHFNVLLALVVNFMMLQITLVRPPSIGCDVCMCFDVFSWVAWECTQAMYSTAMYSLNG